MPEGPTKTRTLTCKRCRKTWTEPVRTGGVAKYCMSCRSTKNQARDLKRLEDRGDIDRLEAARDELQEADPNAARELMIRPLRLAVALGATSDPRIAAASVGIDPDDPSINLDALVADARARFPGAAENRPGEIQRITHSAALQAAVSLWVGAPHLTPAQAGPAIRAAAQALDILQQGAKRVFSVVKIVAPPMEGV